MIKKFYYLVFLFCFFIAACGGSGTSPKNTQTENRAPIAISDNFSIDSNIDLPVLDNDSDPDGDSFSISEITQPTNGSAEIVNGTSIRLSIDQDFVGNDSFTYTITDTNGASSTASVQLSLNPASKRPVAVNDRVTSVVNTVIQIDVLENDSDENGDELRVVSVEASENGAVSIVNGNIIQFIPDTNFTGQEEFSYTISDGTFEETASVTLIVNEESQGANLAPIALSDEAIVLFETATLIDVLANDSDPENAELIIEEVIGPDHGSVLIKIISRDGVNVPAVEYTPDLNYIGPDSFLYIVSDGVNSVASSVNIEVRTKAVNLAPLAIDDVIDTGVAIPVNLQPFANDSDPDDDPLLFVDISNAVNGVFTIDDNNTPDDLSDDVLSYTPNPGFEGTEVLIYTLSDGISEDRGVINIFVSDDPVTRVKVTGSVHKGAVSNSVVSVHSFDRNGVALLESRVVAASTELDGSWEAEIPQVRTEYMISAQGGQFIDESDPNINNLSPRVIQLSNTPILQSIWQTGQSHISVTPYTSAVIRKARYESRNNFSSTVNNNIDISQQAMGFDPFTVKPSEPLAPIDTASTESLQYALNLGGFANAMNANATELELSLPTTALIDAVIDDLADCVLDAKFFGTDVFANSQALADVTDINPEIRRFRNNNFSLYEDVSSEIDITTCQQSGASLDFASLSISHEQVAIPDPITSAGDVINYTLTLVNDGTLAITEISPSVVLSNGAVVSLSAAVESLTRDNVLEVGETWEYTSSYVVTQFDIDAGLAITNTASVIAAETGPTPFVSTAVTPLSQNPEFILTNVQTSGPNPATAAGDVLVYTVTIINTGNVNLTGIDPSNTLSNGVELVPGVITESATVDDVLEVGETWTYTTSYIVTQADLDSGQIITNTASVDSNETDSVDTPVSQAPSLIVTNTAVSSSNPVSSAGDMINYTVALLNNGNITLNSVAPTMILSNGVELDLGSANENLVNNALIDVGETWLYTASYIVTQEDIDSGLDLTSTASVLSTQIGQNPIADIATIEIDQTADFSVSVATVNSVNSVGPITYTYNVTNEGNVTLESLVVTDSLSNTVSCAPTSVAVGSSGTCSSSYNVTQADLDAGTDIINIATAAANGISVDSAAAVTSVSQLPTLSVSLSTVASVDAVGPITYTYNVTNEGNVTLNALAVTDSLGTTISCSPTTVPVGTMSLCTSSYNVSQADLDAGVSITNIGTASANGVSVDSAPAVTTITQVPSLSVSLSTVASVDAVGPITYTYNVTNEGNVTLNALAVTDSLGTTISCSPTTVPVGTMSLCTSSYNVSQADLDAGASITNIGTANANGVSVDSAPVVTPITQVPSLSVSLSTVASVDAVGPISYNYTVTNEGNVSLDLLQVTDSLGNAVSCTPTSVAVGSSSTCSSSYNVTQAELDAGTDIINIATAAANGISVDSAAAVTSVSQLPALSVSLSTLASVDAVGPITYNYTVTNEGNVTLESLVVTDSLSNTVSCVPTSVAVGSNSTCTSEYTVTQDDVDAGIDLINVATAIANGVSVDSSPVLVAINQNLALSVDLGASITTVNAAGDVINYTHQVNNDGNVTLTNLSVTDTLGTAVTCAPTSVVVGDSVTCTSSYTVTQGDIDGGGFVSNVTTASANGQSVSSMVSDVAINQTVLLNVEISADVASVNAVGDVVNYSYQVSNAGNVTLNALLVNDSLGTAVSCSPTTVPVGGSTSCVSAYTVTQTDMNVGNDLINTATAEANGETVNATVPAVVVINQNTALSVTVNGDVTSVNAADDIINYTYQVTNEGNVTLFGTAISDTLNTFISCVPDTIAVGESITCTSSYIVTQADMDAGSILINTATADANGVSAESAVPYSVQVTQVIAYSVDINTGVASIESAGDVINYDYVISNTGNVTLTGLVVTDTLGTSIVCTPTTIEVGAAAASCSSSYTVTQADMELGGVLSNTATADANGVSVDSSVPAIVPINQIADLSVVLLSDVSSVNAAGDDIVYTYEVTNAGNVELSGLTVSDIFGLAVSCDSTTLAVGDVVSCTSSYSLTQADIDTGADISNIATADAIGAPNSVSVASNEVSVTVSQNLDWTIIALNLSSATYEFAGDVINYEVVVTNTGNVTIDSIAVVDNVGSVFNCTGTSLLPSEVLSCNALYTIQASDIGYIPPSLIDPKFVEFTPSVTGSIPPPSIPSISLITTFTDVTPPEVSLVGRDALYVLAGVDLLQVDEGVTASDANGIDSIVNNIASLDTSTATPQNSPLLIRYTVTDSGGNVNDTVTREVHVVNDPALADSDGDLVSDAIELLVASDPLVANTNVSLLDVNATGDGSSSDWTNASTVIPSVIPSSGAAEDTSFLLLAEGTYFDSFSPTLLPDNDCNNIAIIGSMEPPTGVGQPSLVSLDADNLPTSGLAFDPLVGGQALELSGCDNMTVAYFEISGASGEDTVNKGGAINAVSGTVLTLQNVYLNNNTAELYGAGLNIENATTSVTVNDSVIENNTINTANTTDLLGGGINIGDGAFATITNTQVANNSIQTSTNINTLLGAGISVSDPGTILEISDSVIENNEIIASGTLSSGGGLSVRNGASVIVDNTRIFGNEISGFSSAFDNLGGGVFVTSSNSNVSIINSAISGNRSFGNGGGIAVLNSALFNIHDSFITGNYSESDGGGIAIITSTLSPINIINNLILGNSAFTRGGGIYQEDSSNLRISNNTLMYNQANTGGAYAVASGEINFYNNLSKDNLALSGGGASSDYTLAPLPTALQCTNNGFFNDPGNALCVNSFDTGTLISPLEAEAYKLKVNSNLVDAGINTLVEAEVDGKTTRVDGAVEVPGSNPDLGFHYPGGTVTAIGANADGGANTSTIIEQPISINDSRAVFTIEPVDVNGDLIGPGNSVYVRPETGPAGTLVVAPVTSAVLSGSTGFVPMLDNGDGTYSIIFETGANAGDITISVLSNPTPLVAAPEVFTVPVN